MTLTEGLLIFLVIILTILIFSGKGANKSYSTKSWDCVDRANGNVTNVKIRYSHSGKPGCKCEKCSSPEKRTLFEQNEYFSTCAPTAANPSSSDCNTCDGDLEYAREPYGGSGLDFKDWVMAQAVDPQVVANHAAFVSDRQSQGNWTAIAYSPDSNDSYDPLPWQGLIRPQRVAVCDPTQVPDVDENLYSKRETIRWGGDTN